MTISRVHAAREADAEQLIAALTLAFAMDPVIRAFYPDPRDHLTHYPEMMRIQIGAAIARRSAHYVESFNAAALWFPPAGPDTDYEVEKARRQRLDALIQATASTEGNDDLFAALGEMGRFHPKDPHWYLFAIGVDPHHQSEGLGSLLMQHALPKSDADGIFAYLESSNPRNVPFYQRHGFEVMEDVQVGTSPTFTLMRREPR
jgi:ribosomal protein S18 acetylase RimI-like enzyme